MGFNNFSKFQAKLKIVGGGASEFMDISYVDLFSKESKINSASGIDFDKVAAFSLYGFKDGLLFHEYYKRINIGFERVNELTLPVKLISSTLLQLLNQYTMEKVGVKEISSIFIERPNNRIKTGNWTKLEDYKNNIETFLISSISNTVISNTIITSANTSPVLSKQSPTCYGTCNGSGSWCDVPTGACKRGGSVSCRIQLIQDKIINDNINNSFSFNTSKLYNLRDNFLANYSMGQRYIDNYYVGSEYLNVSSLSVISIQKIISIMPEINNTIDKLNNPDYKGIIISDNFKVELEQLFLDLKTYSTNPAYVNIFNQAFQDLNQLVNKIKLILYSH
jgi:hypothetical protein